MLSPLVWLFLWALVCYYMFRQRRVRTLLRGVRAFFVPTHRIGGMGELWKEESVLMASRVMNVVREFFLGEVMPDWAARDVAGQRARSNAAQLEAATVAMHARR